MRRYAVEILPSAERELARFARDVRVRIIRKIDALAQGPRPPGVKKLQGAEDLHRVRVGDYRVIYRVDDDERVVMITAARRRDRAY